MARVENGVEASGRSKKCRQESVGSVGADEGYREKKKEAGMEVKACIRAVEIVCPSCRV